MPRKIMDITHCKDSYDVLSQTPKNYNKQNYFIKELQDKINAEWNYRPNRVDIDYENRWGEQLYSPIEVVIQSVHGEKGKLISDDYKKIVFKDLSESRFQIGSRFRFPLNFKKALSTEAEPYKDVWLAINTNSVKMTSSMIIERCNGVLGSLVKDSSGISHYHYEPVVQLSELSGARLLYNDIAILPQSQLLIIAQHNDYTRDYFINQRFIIGADQVYRITNKSYNDTTFAHGEHGLTYLYLEKVEKSAQDDFEHRIAAQAEAVIMPGSCPSYGSEYHLALKEPAQIPFALTSKSILFKPFVENAEEILPRDIQLEATFKTTATSANIDLFVNIEKGDAGWTISRKKIYLRDDLQLSWYVPADISPTHEEMRLTIVLNLGQME